jgi:hypothetical protein
MGFWYIAGLHEPITGAGGRPRVLNAHRGDVGRWLSSYWDDPDAQWSGNGAFAYLFLAR